MKLGDPWFAHAGNQKMDPPSPLAAIAPTQMAVEFVSRGFGRNPAGHILATSLGGFAAAPVKIVRLYPLPRPKGHSPFSAKNRHLSFSPKMGDLASETGKLKPIIVPMPLLEGANSAQSRTLRARPLRAFGGKWPWDQRTA